MATHDSVPRPPGAADATDTPERRPEVLILTTSYGLGHARVAEALSYALKALRPDLAVGVRNFADIVYPLAKKAAEVGYRELIQRLPRVYAGFYSATDRPPGRDKAGDLFLSWIDTAGAIRLGPALRHLEPRLVVCLHPVPARMVARLKESGSLKASLVTVITDVEAHGFWVNRVTDLYITACEETRSGLVERGVEAGRVAVDGMPLMPGFGPEDEAAASGNAGAIQVPGRRAVLVMGGGWGMLKNSTDLVAGLLRTCPGRRVVVVTGSNRTLRARLERDMTDHIRSGALEVVGYAEDVAALMKRSCVLVTKPGGVTSFEALAVGLAMVLIPGLPGQEEANARFLVREGVAVRAGDPEDACRAVAGLLSSPARYEAMRRNCARVGRPNAARLAAGRILALLDRGPDRLDRVDDADRSCVEPPYPGRYPER